MIIGCSKNNGEGPGPHSSLCAQVHANESQHPGSISQDPDPQVAKQHGAGAEGSHTCHGWYESYSQPATDTEDTTGTLYI